MTITRPTVLLDPSQCMNKLDRMVQKAQDHGVSLRPHFKTHQSAEIAKWYRAKGIDKATVSSVRMATYFVQNGWNDLTIAFPINFREWSAIDELSKRAQINVILSNSAALTNLLAQTGTKLGVFIKIDVGYHRTGFDPHDRASIQHALVMFQAHPDLTFKGFLSHAGHTYACRTRQEINQVHDHAHQLMLTLKRAYASDFPNLVVSMGSTPSCSVADQWQGVDEMRPGNFIFYDLTQVAIGSCEVRDISVCLASPVVAKHPDRNTIITYGGGVHLSKDRLVWQGKTIFGLPVQLQGGGWSTPDGASYVTSLSQEHGIIQASDDLFHSLEIGDLVGVLPVHSCMMCDLMKSYYVLPEGRVISMMQG